ncbi:MULTISPECIES: putative quinol monooxygenase [unclassified Curtobacterium]|uniref:putative quinol monooxygenase n=1 Tax=unclassified Curtobacterium TaxID=257496 RepID=UPI00082428A8|nr:MULTISPECIES: antibiotic biosynthesis monooxygenase family protein [unclassified Curtobacterium]WIA96875.1 antibiotic biosynthesis monooxygenase family protein [Curtobacterium sp. MCBA15_004]
MGAIRLRGQLVCVTEEEAQRVREHLPEHTRLTRSEPGCVAFEVVPTEDPLRWSVEERFDDRVAFDAHQERVRSSTWGRATAGIQRRYSVTEAAH